MRSSYQKGKMLLKLLKQHNFLLAKRLVIHGDSRNLFTVHDPSLEKGKQERRAQFFISLPPILAEFLPGSLLATRFIEQLFKKEDGFSIKIFYDSFDPVPCHIACLANENGATDKPEKRAQYQKYLFQLSKVLIKKRSQYNLRIIEDCLASGDSIVGVLSLFYQYDRLSIVNKKVRIDVIVATPQGIAVLKRFARDNQIEIEINVGYLGLGLSEGESIRKYVGIKKHANYIVYAGELTSGDKNKGYVVGDMGDFSKSLPREYDDRYPWNKFRNDLHGDRVEAKPEIPPLPFNLTKPSILYLSNGGYLLKAFYHLLNPKDDAHNQIIFSAKRVWSDEKKFNYGVLIKGFDSNLLNFLI